MSMYEETIFEPNMHFQEIKKKIISHCSSGLTDKNAKTLLYCNN